MHAPPIDLSAFNALVTISAPRVSPKGNEIAFLATRRDFATNSNEATLDLIAVSGGVVRVLTRASADLSDPQWSPLGDRIAYVDRGGRNKKKQIFVLALGESAPHQVTSAVSGVEQFAWSPDGRRLVYVTQDSPPNAAAIKRGENLFEIRNDGYRIDAPAEPSHLWLVSANGGVAQRLTEGSWSVLESAPPFVGALSDPSWSADGRYIAFTRQADADNSDSDLTTIAVLDLRAHRVMRATTHPKYEYQPLFAISGDRLDYIYPHGPGPISVMDLFTASPASTTTRDLTGSFDRDITQMEWLPHGGALVMADEGVGVGLWRIAPNRAPVRLDLGALNVESFDVGKTGAIALVLSNERAAPELYVLAHPGAAPRQLTSMNARFERYAYGAAHELRWRSDGGFESDGIVTYPVGYVAGRTYPLVVYIHGGPEAASSQTFGIGEIGRLRYGLSGRGFIVFEPNYRGSDNLGNAYAHAIYRDPGTGPGNDVMAGIAALEKTGVVNTSRISIVGHSYGGYMTTWLIGHEHIWRCAVVADGMVDWREEYDLSAAGNLAWTRDSLGGTPMDPAAAALYITGSPITYADQVTTPTLILSGTSDETVPITESFALYHALRDRRIPVRFIGLPGALHSPGKPWQVDLYYATILAWVTSRT